MTLGGPISRLLSLLAVFLARVQPGTKCSRGAVRSQSDGAQRMASVTCYSSARPAALHSDSVHRPVASRRVRSRAARMHSTPIVANERKKTYNQTPEPTAMPARAPAPAATPLAECSCAQAGSSSMSHAPLSKIRSFHSPFACDGTPHGHSRWKGPALPRPARPPPRHVLVPTPARRRALPVLTSSGPPCPARHYDPDLEPFHLGSARPLLPALPASRGRLGWQAPGATPPATDPLALPPHRARRFRQRDRLVCRALTRRGSAASEVPIRAEPQILPAQASAPWCRQAATEAVAALPGSAAGARRLAPFHPQLSLSRSRLRSRLQLQVQIPLEGAVPPPEHGLVERLVPRLAAPWGNRRRRHHRCRRRRHHCRRH